jgi:hypothetical protein
MAFVALSLSTTEILETTYVSDMRIITNGNTGLLKSKLEDLINNLKIDLSDKKIGVDPDTTLTPLTELKTKVLTIQNGQLYFKNATGTADLIKFETETVNSATVGKITTGTLVVNSSITSAGLSISGLSTFTGAITANGQANLAGSVNITGSFSNSREDVTKTLTAVSGANRAKAEVTLTATSKSLIILTLDASAFYIGNAFQSTITDGIDIVLINDTNSPIRPGQEFTIMVRAITNTELGTTTHISGAYETFAAANSATHKIRIIGQNFAIMDQDAVGLDSTHTTLASQWAVGLTTNLFNSSVTLMNVGTVKNSANLPSSWGANQQRLVVTRDSNAIYNI